MDPSGGPIESPMTLADLVMKEFPPLLWKSRALAAGESIDRFRPRSLQNEFNGIDRVGA